MKDIIEKIKDMAKKEISGASNIKVLEELRVKYLGKKGEITQKLKELSAVSAELKPILGKLLNDVKRDIEELLAFQMETVRNLAMKEELEREKIDVTIPGKRHIVGARHPLNIITNEIVRVFSSMGFSVVAGPEIEWEKYNFDMLNMPKNHPARDESDTFFISDELALRTQTSSVQARYMETHKPPIRIISPGRVYRIDEIDATHSPMFHQIEGLIVEQGINMGHLKHTLDAFAKAFYGTETKTRFRPHHFQFTEPSAEMDMSCFNCGGAGCRVCKNEGWIELLGCGMVHPKVLAMCGINPDEYTGFAFGMGLDRAAMQKFAINNLKLFFENDVRFLKQF